MSYKPLYERAADYVRSKGPVRTHSDLLKLAHDIGSCTSDARWALRKAVNEELLVDTGTFSQPVYEAPEEEQSGIHGKSP